MIKEQTKEDWMQKFQNHFRRYCGSLTLDYGLSIKDVGVYIFLVSQKWHFGKHRFSPYEIFRKLNTMPLDFILKEFKTNHTEKSVLESLNRLEALRFVKKCGNDDRTNTGGRPAKALYEATNITELKNFTQTRLDATRGKMLNLIDELLNIEESFELSANNMEKKK